MLLLRNLAEFHELHAYITWIRKKMETRIKDKCKSSLNWSRGPYRDVSSLNQWHWQCLSLKRNFDDPLLPPPTPAPSPSKEPTPLPSVPTPPHPKIPQHQRGRIILRDPGPHVSSHLADPDGTWVSPVQTQHEPPGRSFSGESLLTFPLGQPHPLLSF